MFKVYDEDQCSFDDLKIGEVFAYNGCWEIYCKINFWEAMLLASTFAEESLFGSRCDFSLYDEGIYKLPKRVQNLWITQ